MAASTRILVVDDEEIAARNLAHVMTRAGYDVSVAFSGPEGLAMIDKQSFDLLLTDLRMERIDGMALLKAAKARQPETEVIVITGFATTEGAVDAMKNGAFHYVAKPFHFDEVRKVVAEAVEKVALRRENRRLREEIASYRGQVRIVTQDAATQRVLDLARQVAPTDSNVLVTGESGTGKELLVAYLHEHSNRRKGPLIAVNCGAFNKELFANELFGHEREAFTGASSARKGLIEAASGGTLFLDEITEMPPEMQVKLLRVIQEREVLRLGATTPVKIDVRFVAATNRDVLKAVANGMLRQDLYFRLNVISLHIPPLAQRPDDIPLLVQHFLRKHALETGASLTVAPAVLERLRHHIFPGNVRELENIIERGIAVARGNVLELEDLPAHFAASDFPAPALKEGRMPTLEEHGAAYIWWVLDQVGGNQSAAAQVLGINRSSLWRKLKILAPHR
ncbi:MAG TPA: sigma-54 dependent transcriptional regulator [Rhodocyclaceae bacterium]|nr:sigma-54 dependent transcriptional regulator [Rhodocyclaceae bacterium]